MLPVIRSSDALLAPQITIRFEFHLSFSRSLKMELSKIIVFPVPKPPSTRYTAFLLASKESVQRSVMYLVTSARVICGRGSKSVVNRLLARKIFTFSVSVRSSLIVGHRMCEHRADLEIFIMAVYMSISSRMLKIDSMEMCFMFEIFKFSLSNLLVVSMMKWIFSLDSSARKKRG